MNNRLPKLKSTDAFGHRLPADALADSDRAVGMDGLFDDEACGRGGSGGLLAMADEPSVDGVETTADDFGRVGVVNHRILDAIGLHRTRVEHYVEFSHGSIVALSADEAEVTALSWRETDNGAVGKPCALRDGSPLLAVETCQELVFSDESVGRTGVETWRSEEALQPQRVAHVDRDVVRSLSGR